MSGAGPGPPPTQTHGLVKCFRDALVGHPDLKPPTLQGFTTGLLLSLHTVTVKGLATRGVTKPFACQKHRSAAVLVCSACSQVVCVACYTAPVVCCSPIGATYHPQTDSDWIRPVGDGILAEVDHQRKMAMLSWHINYSWSRNLTKADRIRCQNNLDCAVEDVRLAADAGLTSACLQYAKMIILEQGLVDSAVHYMCGAAECQRYALTCVIKWLKDTHNVALYQDALAWGTITEFVEHDTNRRFAASFAASLARGDSYADGRTSAIDRVVAHFIQCRIGKLGQKAVLKAYADGVALDSLWVRIPQNPAFAERVLRQDFAPEIGTGDIFDYEALPCFSAYATIANAHAATDVDMASIVTLFEIVGTTGDHRAYLELLATTPRLAENVPAANMSKLWATGILAAVDDYAALHFAKAVFYGRYGIKPNRLRGMAILSMISTKEAYHQLAVCLENRVRTADNRRVIRWAPWQSLFLALMVYGVLVVVEDERIETDGNDHLDRLADLKTSIDRAMRC